MAYACFCYFSFSQHPCRLEITRTPNPARDEIIRHFSLSRRATSATSGMHGKFHLCLQQRCANCITQDFLLRPRRSYFVKWSQGQHKCHHRCVWTTKMGKEKTTNTHWAPGIFPLQYKWLLHWTSPCKGRFSNCASSAKDWLQVHHVLALKCWKLPENQSKCRFAFASCIITYAMQLLHLRSRSWRDSTPLLQSQANLVNSKRFHVDETWMCVGSTSPVLKAKTT